MSGVVGVHGEHDSVEALHLAVSGEDVDPVVVAGDLLHRLAVTDVGQPGGQGGDVGGRAADDRAPLGDWPIASIPWWSRKRNRWWAG